MDFASGIIFIRDAIVCNSTPVDQVAPTLDPLAQEPNRRETVNLLTHEQYFWPFYPGYVARPCPAVRGGHPLGHRSRLQAGLLPRGAAGRAGIASSSM